MPKKDDRLVGVASQCVSSLGKTANCQTLVSLTLARGEVPGGTTSLHSRELDEQSGADEASERSSRARARGADEPVIALAEIDRVTAAGMRFGCVLADAGYRRLVDTWMKDICRRGLVSLFADLRSDYKAVWVPRPSDPARPPCPK
jgi:SRSO17 transposase